MTRASWFGLIVLGSLCILGSSQLRVTAQTTDSSLQNIRTAIIQAMGIPVATIDLKVAGNIFVISRINSTMNQTNHGARDSEASHIATVVAKTIGEGAEYKHIHTIRVRYIAALKPGGNEQVVDTVDFRKDPKGIFHFHTT
jgi:thiamine biosynthesis protein ThiC